MKWDIEKHSKKNQKNKLSTLLYKMTPEESKM